MKGLLDESGAAGTVLVYLPSPNLLYVANVGDAKAILGDGEQRSPPSTPLPPQHTSRSLLHSSPFRWRLFFNSPSFLPPGLFSPGFSFPRPPFPSLVLPD